MTIFSPVCAAICMKDAKSKTRQRPSASVCWEMWFLFWITGLHFWRKKPFTVHGFANSTLFIRQCFRPLNPQLSCLIEIDQACDLRRSRAGWWLGQSSDVLKMSLPLVPPWQHWIYHRTANVSICHLLLQHPPNCSESNGLKTLPWELNLKWQEWLCGSKQFSTLKKKSLRVLAFLKCFLQNAVKM